MADKVQKSVRVAPDLAEYLEDRAEQTGDSEANVMRRLLRDGVRYRQEISDVSRRLQRVEKRLGQVEGHTSELVEESNSGGLLG